MFSSHLRSVCFYLKAMESELLSFSMDLEHFKSMLLLNVFLKKLFETHTFFPFSRDESIDF